MNTCIDLETCAGCGGRCCKLRAGALFASDIKGPMCWGPGEMLSIGMYQIDWYERNPMMSFEELRGLYHIADRRAEEGPEPRSEGQGILHPPDSFGDT